MTASSGAHAALTPVASLRTTAAMLLRRVLALALFACAIAGSTATAKGLRFPDGFRWGTAISGFQSDMGVGAPNDEGTDWWVWTHDPQNIASGSVSGAFPEDGPGFWTLYKRDAKLVRKALHGNASGWESSGAASSRCRRRRSTCRAA